AVSWRPGTRVLARELGQSISLEVIIRAVFGVEDEARVAAFHAAVVDLSAAAAASFLFFRRLQRGWFLPWRRFQVRSRALSALLREQIGRARTRTRTRSEDAAAEAILPRLL